MLRSDVQELDLDGFVLYHALLRDLVPDKLRNDGIDTIGARAADDNGNAWARRHSEAGKWLGWTGRTTIYSEQTQMYASEDVGLEYYQFLTYM